MDAWCMGFRVGGAAAHWSLRAHSGERENPPPIQARQAHIATFPGSWANIASYLCTASRGGRSVCVSRAHRRPVYPLGFVPSYREDRKLSKLQLRPRLSRDEPPLPCPWPALNCPELPLHCPVSINRWSFSPPYPNFKRQNPPGPSFRFRMASHDSRSTEGYDGLRGLSSFCPAANSTDVMRQMQLAAAFAEAGVIFRWRAEFDGWDGNSCHSIAQQECMDATLKLYLGRLVRTLAFGDVVILKLLPSLPASCPK